MPVIPEETEVSRKQSQWGCFWFCIPNHIFLALQPVKNDGLYLEWITAWFSLILLQCTKKYSSHKKFCNFDFKSNPTDPSNSEIGKFFLAPLASKPNHSTWRIVEIENSFFGGQEPTTVPLSPSKASHYHIRISDVSLLNSLKLNIE